METNLVIIRHSSAEVEARSGIDTGRHLTADGIDLALRRRAQLGTQFDLVITSTTWRALETGLLIAGPEVPLLALPQVHLIGLLINSL